MSLRYHISSRVRIASPTCRSKFRVRRVIMSPMTRRRRILVSLAVAAVAAWGLWLAPLQRPRAILRHVDPDRVWFSPDSQLVATGEVGGEPGTTRVPLWYVVDGRPAAALYTG